MSTEDNRAFRDTMGNFCSGVVVVTGTDGSQPLGFTAQSFVSLSLEPRLIAICPAKTSTTWPKIENSGSFCINILRAGQESLSNNFARSSEDKFSGVSWRSGVTSSPILSDVLSFVDCEIQEIHDAGDHLIVVGSVVDFGITDPTTEPLLFFRGKYGTYEQALTA